MKLINTVSKTKSQLAEDEVAPVTCTSETPTSKS